VWRQRVVDLRPERLRMGASDRTAMKLAVGQAGAMREQIAERDRTRRLVGLIEWTIGGSQHPRARHLRCALRDRGVEIASAPARSRQPAGSRDGFRRRGGAKAWAGFTGPPADAAGAASRRKLPDCPVPPDHRRGPATSPRLDAWQEGGPKAPPPWDFRLML